MPENNNTIPEVPFTKKDRFVIAEFVYSRNSDILIVTDCEALVEVLANHKLITDKEKWDQRLRIKDDTVVSDLSDVLTAKISNEQGKGIMDEYFGKA